MSNHHLRNKELSLKAKGLFSVILSLPDDWDYTVKGLAYICKEGADSIRGALKELEQQGYIERSRVRNEKGQLTTAEYIIHEQPEDISVPSETEPTREVGMRFKRLTPENRRKVNAVARKQCCNYDNGNCILLDNGDICDCPHLISFSLNCKGFRTAVLPNDKELYAKLIIPDCYEITRTGDTVSLVITPSNDKSQLVLKANTIDISNLLMRHTRFNGFVELQTLWNTIYV